MKTAFKELWEIQKVSFGWCKKHWKSYSVMILASGFIGYGLPKLIEKIVDWKDSKER